MLTPEGAGDPREVAAAFLNSLTGRGPIVVGVSGGGDSIALLTALHLALAEGMAPARQLIAATVDHGLRPASADEARQVGDFCAARGIEHHVLRWQGDKPASGIQAEARLARYRLLSEVAGRVGAVAVATAHTLDDQAETIAMRAARAAEEARGLAGIAPATLFERKTWLIRPFLMLSREQLRHWLVEHRIAWIEDPSNEDTRFERVRVRAGGAIVDIEAIAAHQRLRQHRSERLAALIAERAVLHGGAIVSFDRSGVSADDCRDAIATLMVLVGGRPYLPGRAVGRSIAAFLAGDDARMNAARAIVERRGRRLCIYREQRAVPTLRLGPGESTIYDGRYDVELAADAPSVTLVPAGMAMVAEAAGRPEFDGLPPAIVRRALSAEPVTASDGSISFVTLEPHRYVRITRRLALFDVFLPLFDLTLANGSAALFSRAAYPPPPL